MTLHARIELSRGSLDLAVGLTIAPDEVVAVLGPNGAGKTTLLRAIAGLAPIESGRVTLDGTVLEDPAVGIRLPPDRRGVGLVFQEYGLFPHLEVRDNVGFPLRARGLSARAARAEAMAWLERLDIAELSNLRPSMLSGGQSQRVALARALASRPRLLALDEPLAALDAKARAEVRRGLRRHLTDFDGPSMVITHDPLEAAMVATRIVIVERGRVTQEGTIEEITRRPRSRWVAELVGVNLLHGHSDGRTIAVDSIELVAVDPPPGPVEVVIRPRAVALHPTRPEGSPRNTWQARVDSVEGQRDRVWARVTGPITLVAEITPAALAELGLTEGSAVWVAVKATEIEVYA